MIYRVEIASKDLTKKNANKALSEMYDTVGYDKSVLSHGRCYYMDWGKKTAYYSFRFYRKAHRDGFVKAVDLYIKSRKSLKIVNNV